MAFLDLLDNIGGLGLFQLLNAILLTIPGFLTACHALLQNFSAAIPDHHCRIPNQTSTVSHWTFSFSELSNKSILKAFIPLEKNNNPSKCERYLNPQWTLLILNETTHHKINQTTEKCQDGWDYDRREFLETIVSEWDLVCSRKPLKQMSQTVYMGGVLAGAIILGRLSDKFGRRRVLTWSYFLLAVSGTSTAFSPSYFAFCCFRFLCGLAAAGITLNAVSLMMEWIPTKSRACIGTLGSFGFTAGQLLLAGIAYSIRTWRKLQLSISVPFFFFFVCSWWIPESARWLVLNNHYDKAVREIQRVARINHLPEEGKKITVEVLHMHMDKEIHVNKTSHTHFDLVRIPQLRKITICLMILWCSCSLGYYGLVMDLQKFGLSMYLAQIIFALMDFPSLFINLTLLNLLGRRITQGGMLIIAGGVVLAIIFVPEDMKILQTVLAMIGTGFMGAAFTSIYIYTGELYPTVIRQTGMGFGSTMARIGSMSAPVVLMLDEYFSYLPSIVFGIIPIFAGFSAFMLPETLNVPLPDTIKDVELQMSKKKENLNELQKDSLSLQEIKVSVISHYL
ncbi:solute carrier family 22 member 6-A-like [Polypterus senegalus]|uniref:solute carrier family 22 member 6-A-like n=1 Tax=Polypterus senegalus TaxID=55291 RepID=UPI001963B184|nr:solute carrier family 22 member 6-A-like [Polypterus senegalus]